jgi:hypothetical protein
MQDDKLQLDREVPKLRESYRDLYFEYVTKLFENDYDTFEGEIISKPLIRQEWLLWLVENQIILPYGTMG